MIDATIDTRNLQRAMARAPRELSRAVKGAFRTSLRRVETRLVREQLSGRQFGPGGAGGLARRTGTLARSWKVVVVGDGLDLTGVLFTNVPYAAIHEFGGTIRPRRGKWLWIPARTLLTPAGVFRGWEGVKWDSVFFRRSRRNARNLVALEDRGASKPRHVATLAPEVTIPARMGLRELVKQDRPDRIVDLNRAIRFAMERSTRR